MEGTKKQNKNEVESLRMLGTGETGIKSSRTETIYSSTEEAIMVTFALMNDGTVAIGFQLYYRNGVNSSRKVMPEDGVFANEKNAKLWFIGLILSRPEWFSAEAIESLKRQRNELQNQSLFD